MLCRSTPKAIYKNLLLYQFALTSAVTSLLGGRLPDHTIKNNARNIDAISKVRWHADFILTNKKNVHTLVLTKPAVRVLMPPKGDLIPHSFYYFKHPHKINQVKANK